MAILAGECDLTMLNAGHEIVALDRGCTVVGRADEIGPYIGSVLATLGNEPTGDLERLERVLREVSAAIVDGSLEAPARAASSTMLGLSVRHAAQHVAVMRDSRHGLVPSGIVDADSIDTVLTLRERFLPSPALDRARADWRGMLVAQ
ncbi:MAG: hypothetical protein Q7J04_05320 [Microcella sp.]|nr:hypothetical protein [Microcella sp.]